LIDGAGHVIGLLNEVAIAHAYLRARRARAGSAASAPTPRA
jgi:hypothetical protein